MAQHRPLTSRPPRHVIATMTVEVDPTAPPRQAPEKGVLLQLIALRDRAGAEQMVTDLFAARKITKREHGNFQMAISRLPKVEAAEAEAKVANAG